MDTLLEFAQAKAYLLFPLLAAMLYAIGAIALKTSSGSGIDSGRTTFVCNSFIAVAFLIFYDWSSFPSLPQPLWPVLVLAILFVSGQFFTIQAVSNGEVSSVTPVFGVKVILVGFLTAFVIGARVNPLTWIGGFLSVLGIACLQVSDEPEATRRNLLAVLYAFLAAASFAGFDAMTQHWSPILGFGNLVPPGMIIAAALSYGLLPRTRGPWAEIPRPALIYLAIGAGLFTLQALMLIRSIGAYGDAAGANVVYSSRGLWGILFVWLVGTWFKNTELKERQPKVICARVAGALLVCSATVLVFL